MRTPVVLVVGNPNAGKSTLFNTMTGGGAHVGNFPGTTVELTRSELDVGGRLVDLVDVPGTYSLAARSPEERVAIDAVLGLGGAQVPDALVVVCDTPRLGRSLYLVLQLLELEVPMVVALNLMDEARSTGTEPDVEALERLLGVPVIPTIARSGDGLEALEQALLTVMQERPIPGCPHDWSPQLKADALRVAEGMPSVFEPAMLDRPGRRQALALWLLLSVDDDPPPDLPDDLRAGLSQVHQASLDQGRDLQSELVGTRYTWIDAHLPGLMTGAPVPVGDDRVDRVLLHPVWGTAFFLGVMGMVFTMLFSWADPLIAIVETVVGEVGSVLDLGFYGLAAAMPAWAGGIELLGDFVVEGLVGGVGAVLVFLPQIALLFLFISLLEDCGYLARAAHLMDRVLRAAGLPGRAFVPLLSGFACAVPAILATRTMPRFRDRLLTMMVIPLTSCSARLPVYTLLIGALFPPTVAGLALPLRPLMLFGLYLFSTVVTVLAALVLGRLLLPDDATPALLELPPYRLPAPGTVAQMVWSRSTDFVREAGGIILWTTVALWVLLSFPRYEPAELLSPEVIAEHPVELHAELAAPLALERSYAGRIGQTVEPAIAPLGYDWKIGIGLIGAFAAREVFVSTMGLVYGIGDDVDEHDVALREKIRTEKRDDGSPAYTPLVGASILVFFALAMQCLSTLAVLKKETRSWRWPAFVFSYMTLLAWFSAFLVYQGGLLLGLG